MDHILHGLVIPSICVFPSLIYAYQCYKKNTFGKLELVFLNIMAVQIVFTIYLAQVCLN
jgi:hypothetical protein